jgi:hypothetical protein
MASIAQEFAEFYARYPRRIARLDAEKAYGQIRKRGIPHTQIMAGVERYLEHLPEELCYVPYPASWLRAGRFDDEYEVARPVKEYWADECRRVHGGTCSKQWAHATRMMDEREQAS